jgi:tRNA(fMet)-specific endonuclease VapC
MTIADTDVLIDFLTGRGHVATLVAAELERGTLQTTVVNRFELLAGAGRPQQRKILRELLDAVPALSLDAAAADQAAEVRRALESRGEAIGMGDCLIAGIVLCNGGTLLTRNRKHFERVGGLRIAATEGP